MLRILKSSLPLSVVKIPLALGMLALTGCAKPAPRVPREPLQINTPPSLEEPTKVPSRPPQRSWKV